MAEPWPRGTISAGTRSRGMAAQGVDRQAVLPIRATPAIAPARLPPLKARFPGRARPAGAVG
jgi:hypothetical protein